jgi:pimeloyl-ACP methyl ester carboxylesterase
MLATPVGIIDTGMMRYLDWGERCDRWAGIRSEMADARRHHIHLIRADAAPGVATGAPLQLLIHPLAAGAARWLDAMPALRHHGAVLAPDLPGAVFGDTVAAAGRPAAPRRTPAEHAHLLAALLDTIGAGPVVVHGWSHGALVALSLGAGHRSLVRALVLADPALPPLLTPAEARAWRWLGGPSLAAIERLAPVAAAISAGPVLRAKRRQIREDAPPRRVDLSGGSLSRLSPETRALLDEQVATATAPQLAAGIAALAATMRDLTVAPAATFAAIDGVRAPTVIVRGDRDPLLHDATVAAVIARQPTWADEVLAGAGHLAPVELPDDYARAVARGLTQVGLGPGRHDP